MMAFTRRLMLPAGIALAAIAFSAAPAAAQEQPIEVIEEHSGAPCSPCTFHAEGESHIRNVPFGTIVSTCHDELEGTIDHDGTGELEWSGILHVPGGSCADPCSTPEERHWPISFPGEIGIDSWHMTVRTCFGLPDEIHCDAEVQAQETTPGSHHHVLSTNQLCADGFLRLEGSWELESLNHDEIEVIHL